MEKCNLGEAATHTSSNPSTAVENPDEADSTSSTPYASAPSSPGRLAPSHFFFSAPASPVHSFLHSRSSSSTYVAAALETSTLESVSDDFEFEFSARSMISADEIFLNGQILPMKLPENGENASEAITETRGRDLRLKNRAGRRRARSFSPARNAPLEWQEEDEDGNEEERKDGVEKQSDRPDVETDPKENDIQTPSVSASSSRSSSSSSRNSKRWIFLKDLLHRSKSEGSSSTTDAAKDKFWHNISFSTSKDKNTSHLFSFKEKPKQRNVPERADPAKKGTKSRNGVGRRPSAHEKHYTANRAQTEEMRRKTFLPYRQGFLLGCLGFSSRSYGAMNGFARTLNSVASR